MAQQQFTAEENKVLHKMFIRSHLVFMNFNMVKMEANGFTATMNPAIDSIYKDDPEGAKEAHRRHQNFFNTHAVPFAFIAGLCYAMEKEHKEKGSVDGATIESITGMFDSLFFNCLRIIASGIAIGFASQGSILGSFLFILLYGVPQDIVRYFFIRIGYTYGTSFIDSVFNSGLMAALTKAASVMGLMMIGAMTATMLRVPLNLVININGAETNIGDVFNSIFPNLLGCILLFVLVSLIKKGKRPTQLVAGILVVALLGALIGIF